MENLRQLSHAPSVPLQDIPRDIEYEVQEENPDERITRNPINPIKSYTRKLQGQIQSQSTRIR